MSATAAPRYSLIARFFHWGVALLVLAMIPAGVIMVQDGISRDLQNSLFIFHKNVGVLVLLVVILRLIYRAFNPAPPLPHSVNPLQRRISHISHAALYGLLIAMPILGYTRVKAGGFPIEYLDAMGIPSLVPRSDALADAAQTAHYIGGLLLAGLIAAHIGAALLHGVVLRDGVFRRMWFGAAPRG